MAPETASRRGQGPIRYRVAMPEPISHELHVEMAVPALPGRRTCDLVFPAWAPGSYLVRDFVRHVYDLEITDGRGLSLPVERIDKQRWRVRSEGGALRVHYRVFAFEQSVRTSFLDDRHAFWNGTSVFFFIDGELARPCEVEVDAPRTWRISTALPSVTSRRNVFRASGYDELADSPFEIGTHQLHAFRLRGTRFEVALFGRTNADPLRLILDLKRVVEATAALFGGFPFERYLFIVHALPVRGGGLEHARSTTLDIAGLSFEDEKGYQSFAELAAHEFFHAWNVKRIRDRVLGPFDYTGENYTRLLWFHEGFTEYMENVVLLRAGIITAQRYLEDLAERWPKYVARPGRNVTSLSELSFEAWIKQYKPADNHPNRMISYYEKGMWAALVLEVTLRQASGGRRGVPHLFRRLWERFGRKDGGITAADIRASAEDIAGRSLAGYFSRYIDGTVELPVPAMLRRAGIKIEVRAPWQDDDPTKGRRQRGWSGLSFMEVAQAAGGRNDRALVKNVVPDSPAWRAGLTYGDEIVAVDGYRANAASVGKRLADKGPGEKTKLTYFRQEILQAASLELRANPERRWRLSVDDRPKAKVRAIRRGWLGV